MYRHKGHRKGGSSVAGMRIIGQQKNQRIRLEAIGKAVEFHIPQAQKR